MLNIIILGNRWQIDIPFCHKQGKDKLNLECYYEPWSNCTLQDALGDKTVYQLRVENNGYLHPDGGTRQVYDKKYIDEKALLVELNSGFDWDYPVVLDTLRQCSPFSPSKLKYWWRAVSVTYLMRLNDATRKLIHHFKYNETSSMYFDKENEQCVSVYARRGDKHLEMQIMKNETAFFETAKLLWNTQMTPRLNSNQERPIMFVASEDASVIDSAIEWGKVNNWKIIYTDLFDRRQVIAGLSISDRTEWVKTHPVRNHHLEYFSMILNIDSHIQCDAFVCQMPSNFCRLIDELKATVGVKANTILADFHDSSETPCYTGDCIDVDW